MRMRAEYVSVVHGTGVGVAERFRSQYQRDGKWTDITFGKSEDIYKGLVALGTNPDIAAVADLIGNKSWSYVSCEGCGESVEIAVALGAYKPKNYCPTCIEEAAEVLKP